MSLISPPPLSVYVHLPWCVRKCPYCDFNSHEARGPTPYRAYIDALLEDLAEEAPLAAGRPVESVFFGGGTPSLCPPEEIGRFLAGLAQRLSLSPAAEITLEANPGALERGRFADFAAAGVSRVSLGVQSFEPAALAAIGRIHDDRQALDAIDALHAAGIDNFNLDLMYGLPGQDVRGAVRDVELALASGASHVSHYQLTLEPGTPFFRRPPALPDEDAVSDMEEACRESLDSAGFARYEVSAWARAGRECRHNLNYWRFGDYLGVGAGAHGKLTAADGVVRRRWKHRRPAVYLQGPVRLEGQERLCGPDLAFEFMLNALRLTAGVSRRLFQERTGLSPEHIREPLEQARERGLMEPVPGGWRPTPAGRRFLNDLQALFLPPGPGG